MPLVKLRPDDIREALALQAKSWTNARIAERFGVHPDHMQRVLAKQNQKQLERIASRRGAVRMRQVHQLDHMADEAMQAWERSKAPAQTVKVLQGVTELDKDGKPVRTGEKTEKTVKGQCGDVSYLSEARAALAEIRKVLKIDDGTKKVDMSLGGSTGPGSAPITIDVQVSAATQLTQWRQQMQEQLMASLEYEEVLAQPSDNGHGTP